MRAWSGDARGRRANLRSVGRVIVSVLGVHLAVVTVAPVGATAAPAAPASSKSASVARARSSGHAVAGAAGQGGGHASGRAVGHAVVPTTAGLPEPSPAQRETQRLAANRRVRAPAEPQGRSGAMAVAGTSAPVSVRRATIGQGTPGAPTDLRTFRATDLKGTVGTTAKPVDEPSVANDGNVVLYTGNWYAALSQDSGATFRFIDPNNLGPAPTLPNGGFCCDQVAIHTPAISGYDETVWGLLYCPLTACDTGDNLVRLAVARNQGALSRASFDFYDFSAQSFGFPEGDSIDYPHLAANAANVFLSFNVFNRSNGFVTSMMVRFDDSAFAAGYWGARWYWNNQDFTWTPADDSHDIWGYWGASASGNGSLIRVYNWPRGTDYTSISWNDFAVSFAYATSGTSCPDQYGINWCSADDSRVKTGGEIGTTTLYFMWDSASVALYGRPYPYVDYAWFDVTSGPARISSEAQIWGSDGAYAYPGLGVDGAGNLGLSVQHGGGSWGMPSSFFGIDDDVSGHAWSLTDLADSTDDNSRWGDFLTARGAETSAGTGNTWLVAGYTMRAGSADTHPAFYWIGRNRDDPFVPTLDGTLSPIVAEGGAANLTTGLFEGPSNCTCDYYGLNSWGDGASDPAVVTAGAGGPGLFDLSGTHTYAEEGNYGMHVYLYDVWGGGATSGSATAYVSDAPLAHSAVALTGRPGQAISGTVATFTDADPGGTASDFSAKIDWGDSTPVTSGTIAGGFTVSGTHTYSQAGTFTVTVTVADQGGATTKATGPAGIYARPAVTKVSPTAGPLTGGGTVVITGRNLAGATRVLFGGVQATITSVSATRITATAPQHPAGSVDVTVTTPGGTSAGVTADRYTYVPAPTVTSISPAQGAAAGGTTVTVNGTNFRPVTKVLFGSAPGTAVHVLSPTKLTVNSPAGTAGSTVEVTVKTAGGTSGLVPGDRYRYV